MPLKPLNREESTSLFTEVEEVERAVASLSNKLDRYHAEEMKILNQLLADVGPPAPGFAVGQRIIFAVPL